MNTRVRVSTDFDALIDAMKAETEGCDEFWAASAFLSRAAVLDVLDAAGEATVRLLTGTMGSSTRKGTYAAILKRVGKKVAARIWHCGRHGDFHTKLYLWRTGTSGVAWIGSANFTDGGLTNAGETVLEIRAPWKSGTIKALATSFNREWKKGVPLSETWVAGYREAKRVAFGQGKAKKRARGATRVPGTRFFATSVEHHIAEDSKVGERIARLVGDDRSWMRHFSKTLASLKNGDRGIIVDQVDKEMALVEVIDTAPDDGAWVFSYEALAPRLSAIPWSRKTRERLATVTVLGKRGSVRTRYLNEATFEGVRREFSRRRG